MRGFVYAIQAVDGGPVKIGWSEKPEKRLGQLQTGHHSELRVVDSFPATQAHELQLHTLLAASAIRGEWFEDTPQLWEAVSTARRQAERENLRKQIENTVIRSMTLAVDQVVAGMDEDEGLSRDLIVRVWSELAEAFADAMDEVVAAAVAIEVAA